MVFELPYIVTPFGADGAVPLELLCLGLAHAVEFENMPRDISSWREIISRRRRKNFYEM